MSEIIDSEIKDAEKRVTVIVPSYQPDEKLLRVVTGLEALGFDDIIVVNDGSSEDKKVIFEEAASHPAVTLLTHPQNRGKGAALRTAFSWFSENRPDREGVVTADGALAGILWETGDCWALARAVTDPRLALGGAGLRTDALCLVEGDPDLSREGLLKATGFSEGALLPGDRVVTAGSSGLYPAGLTVGTVREVSLDAAGLTYTAVIEPARALGWRLPSPVPYDRDEYRRIDWVWRDYVSEWAEVKATLRRAAKNWRRLAGSSGYGYFEDLSAADIVALLPVVAEMSPTYTPFRHLYLRGGFNLFI